ncbi:DUF2062 domain-containing protein [Bacteroidota bacterium]
MKIIEKIKSAVNSKYLAPIKKLLMQGSSPKAIAFGLAAALVLGLFPVIGSTTILITLFALVFRLNLPLMQLVNYTIFPLQIIVIVPLMKLGEIIFGFEKLSYTASEIAALVSEDMLNAIELLWNVTMQAIGAWLIVAPLIALTFFYLLFPVIKKMKMKIATIQSRG